MARHIFVGGLLAGLLGGGEALQAQDLRDFAYADSLTTALAGQGSWRLLDSVGARALAVGTDYPALRQRLGYAALQQQKPALAVRHYGAASRANPADEASRYQLALAYLYLGQPGPARLAARPLPDSLRYLLRLRPWQAVRAVEVEGGARPAAGRTRGTAGFARLGLSSQLGARVALTQSGAYYGQQVRVPTAGLLPTYTIRQGEYHALLVTQLHQLWQLKLGYSYLFTRFGPVPYRGHLGYAALRYARPYWSAQVGLYAGRLTDTARYQPEAHLTVYPLGNLYLYAFGRSSVVRSGARAYPNALVGVGGRLATRLWGEGYWSPGRVPVLAEQDGTYVYNLLDPLRYRLGATAYVPLTGQWRLAFYYTVAQYAEIRTTTSYLQHSLTAGLTWTW